MKAAGHCVRCGCVVYWPAEIEPLVCIWCVAPPTPETTTR